ncbi:pyruvate decarboxylase 1-like [Rutidosis leptorrhynchoides]|uniref:pyruvate decarboxylase 1-like n=1 Tax=Rutidosis leptorrhynchoides TaxID=125765 RepID=UPI003A994217
MESKPVYISIGCNLPGICHHNFSRKSVPFSLSPMLSNKLSLEAAIEVATEFLNNSVKPVIVAGPQLRVAQACQALVELVDASGYTLAVMPAGKGLVPEHHPHFIGTYWGYSLLVTQEKAIIVQPDRVVIGNGPTFGCVMMKDFMRALATRLKKNTTAYENYKRIYVPEGQPLRCDPKGPLMVNVLFEHIKTMLNKDITVIVETGDS